MDNIAKQDNGHGGDVQARQSDDGTFELVVSDSAAHATAGGDTADRHSAATPLSKTPNKKSWGARRVGLILVLIALLVGLGVYAFSGSNEEPEPAEQMAARSGGFQPYTGGGAAPAAEGGARARAAAVDRPAPDERSRDEEPVRARPTPQPTRRDSDRDDEDWELNEAELLEEAREAERAEQEANAAQSDEAQDDAETAEQQADSALQDSVEQARRPQLDGSDRRINATDMKRIPAGRINPSRLQPVNRQDRPPLRGLRGLQRRKERTAIDRGAEQDQSQGQNDEGRMDEDLTEEQGQYERNDRVPGFGRD